MTAHDWNATLYDQKHAFVFGYGKSLVAYLEARPGEVILDLGCGTGHLTAEIAQTGARVVGIDGSPAMIETARATSPTLEFQVADARTFAFPYTFDAIFSNATLHWIREADQVAACIVRALKPGGRFVAEFGAQGNIATIISSTQQAIAELCSIEIENEWYFPSAGEYTTLLERHGLTVRNVARFKRPTPLEGEDGFQNWLKMFGQEKLLRQVPLEIHPQVLQRAEELARTQLYKDGQWFADYERLRVIAHKE